MRLTPRRRAALAVLVGFPLGYFYLDFLFFTLANTGRRLLGSSTVCDQSWPSYLNSCASFSWQLAIFEILATTAVAVAVAIGLARWVVQPIRDMAGNVARFGPNSLGLRLRVDGPRDETRRLADEIDTMLDRLAEGYESQRRFASTASHELRTPLATQRALIEVSLAGTLTEEQLALLARQLLATNERNEQLVDGLLTLAETERGRMTSAPIRLDAVTADVLEVLAPAAKQREVEINSTLAPVTVLGELPLLDRLVSNLVFNAIKYNVPGGTVTVSLTEHGVLTVANTGPVILPEQVAGLFEPFRKISGERLDHGGGVGLGLTIARSIVAAHGGAIEARANPGGGLVVQVGLTPASRSS